MEGTSTNAFNKKLQEFNEKSALATSIICLGVLFPILLLDYIRWKNGILQTDRNFLILAYMHLTLIAFFIPLLNIKLKFFSLKPRGSLGTNAQLCLAIVYLTLAPFSFMAAYSHDQIIAFAVFICIINLFFETDIKRKFYINILIFIAMTIVYFMKPETFLAQVLGTVEALSIVSFTYVLARNRHQGRIKTHEDKIQLQEKNSLLQEQNQIIAKQNQDLSSFAYATSHDLKEPLRMISSFIKLLDKSLEDKIDGDDRQCMEYINGGVESMEQMLDGLLEYATLDREIKDIESIRLNEILSEASSNLSFAISQADVNISIQDNMPRINVSKILSIQLFQNLISNAIKFRKKEKETQITIDCVKTNKNIIISVEDNGIGIPENELENIFGIFNRLHNKNEIVGHGIGLASCRKIVEKMNGKIWVESEYKIGSTFFVSLPITTKTA